jgi:hypothetical protein
MYSIASIPIYFSFIVPMPLMMPNADKSHNITAITTTAFRMVLIGRAMGIYALIKPSKTPTITNTITIESNDIEVLLVPL